MSTANFTQIPRWPASAELPKEIVWSQRTAEAAFSLACHVSGLDDKEIYLTLGIDPGHFSRIKKGDAGFPPNRVRDFCMLVKNTIYPEWVASQVGCTLVMVKSEAQRRTEEAEARAAKAEETVALLKEMLSGRAIA